MTHGLLRKSVFGRLLVAVIATGVLVNGLVIGALTLAVDHGPVARRVGEANARRYLDYLAKDIGLPPDPVRMRMLSRELGAEIRIDYRGKTYATAAGLPSRGELGPLAASRLQRFGVPFGRYQGRVFVGSEHDGAFYTFFGPIGAHWELREELLVPLLAVLSLALLFLFLLIRRILRPVTDLSTGVQRLAAGDFGHRVPQRGADELARLAGGFNTMAERLEEMMERKEQLLLDVSHELRSPMTRIRVALSMLDDSKMKASIEDDVAEMDRMTGDLLESARFDRPDAGLATARIDLAPLARSVVAAYRQRVAWTGPEEGLFAQAHAGHARTALKNLIDNALKYSEASGAGVDVSGAGTELTVRDRGIGIPAEELARVFEPFYRVDKSRTKATGGFGLGLSLVKKIMEAQGGSVRLASEPGRGTTAVLTFGKSVE